MKTLGVLLMAGSGKRMNLSTKKQYITIYDLPVFMYSLLEFEKSKIDDIILVLDKDNFDYVKKIIKKYDLKKIKYMVEGGSERYYSVYNALKSTYESKEYKKVLIHDSARPMIRHQMIDNLIDELDEYEVLTLAVPVKDTIRQIENNAKSSKTLDRSLLYSIQTPQAFDYDLLVKSYEKIICDKSVLKNITDDVMVVETAYNKYGKLIIGDYQNIKLTTKEDIALAKIFLKDRDDKVVVDSK